MNKVKLSNIFWYFFWLGLLTIGGGYAMISLMEKELCEKRKWLSTDEFLEIIAVSQSLPGVLASNVSTFIGQKLRGGVGAVIATIGVTLPSLLVILAIYPILNKSFQSDTVNKIYTGVQAGVIMLILNSAITMYKSSIKVKFSKILFLICLVVLILFDLNPIYIILFGFVSGYANFLFERRF